MRQGDLLIAPMNTRGRDFAIGDIHGEFDKVVALMEQVKFDPAKDRMFAVGDLVDRGPQSKDALNWMAQPWFFSVMGNHELMAIEAFSNPSLHLQKMHIVNGGQWFWEMSGDKQAEFASKFAQLPLAIEVQVNDKLCGVVHAEPFLPDWAKMRNLMVHRNTTQDNVNVLLWARDRIRDMDPSPIDNIDVVFVGHTPTKEPMWIENTYYIDQGACFGRKMTMVNMDSMEVFQA